MRVGPMTVLRGNGGGGESAPEVTDTSPTDTPEKDGTVVYTEGGAWQSAGGYYFPYQGYELEEVATIDATSSVTMAQYQADWIDQDAIVATGTDLGTEDGYISFDNGGTSDNVRWKREIPGLAGPFVYLLEYEVVSKSSLNSQSSSNIQIRYGGKNVTIGMTSENTLGRIGFAQAYNVNIGLDEDFEPAAFERTWGVLPAGADQSLCRMLDSSAQIKDVARFEDFSTSADECIQVGIGVQSGNHVRIRRLVVYRVTHTPLDVNGVVYPADRSFAPYDTYADLKAEEGLYSAGDIVCAGDDVYQKSGTLGFFVPIDCAQYIAHLLIVPRLAVRDGWSDTDVISSIVDMMNSSVTWTMQEEATGTLTYHASGGPGDGPYLQQSTQLSGMTTGPIKSPSGKAQITLMAHLKPDSTTYTNADYWSGLRSPEGSARDLILGGRFSNNTSGGALSRPSIASLGEETSGASVVSTSNFGGYCVSGVYDAAAGDNTHLVLYRTFAASNNERNCPTLAVFSTSDFSDSKGSGPLESGTYRGIRAWSGGSAGFSHRGRVSTWCTLMSPAGTRIDPTIISRIERWLGREIGLYEEGIYGPVTVQKPSTSALVSDYASLPSEGISDGDVEVLSNGTIWVFYGGYWHPALNLRPWLRISEGANNLSLDASTQTAADILTLGWVEGGSIADGTFDSQSEIIVPSGSDKLEFPCTVPSEFIVLLEGRCINAASANNTPFTFRAKNGEVDLIFTWSEDGVENRVAVVESFSVDGQDGSYAAQPHERLWWHVKTPNGSVPGISEIYNTAGDRVSYIEYSELDADSSTGKFIFTTASDIAHSGSVRLAQGWEIPPAI